MKKWLFTIIVALMPFMAGTFTSCSSDNLPKVKISLDVAENTPTIDGVVYVVKGDSIHVNKLTVTNLDSSTPTILNRVMYRFDYSSFTETASPFAIDFPTKDASVGNHEIYIECQVLATGSPVCFAVCSFPVKVVASKEDIPTGNSTATVEKVVEQTEK
ncbi:MAG: hypothetical protein HUJ97_06895 [Bacteroidales bacterium]|nr:hypothetical protein [Bacteroidales bacterium]